MRHRSPFIGSIKSVEVVRPEHEADRLAAETIRCRLVLRSGDKCPIKEEDFLKGVDCTPNLSLG
jgi:hypothetical protein